MSKRTRYHVTPAGNSDWKVKKEGASKASGVFKNKTDAVDKGRDFAKGSGLGQLIIHKQDGTIQTEHTYRKDPFPPKG